MPTPQPPELPVRPAEQTPHGLRIKVVGVGGGGSNAIDRMIDFGVEGVEFIALNTDIQALKVSKAPVRGQIGSRLTHGLSAGSDPDIGRRAAIEDAGQIAEALEGADMVFITAGLGGGTGTGAAPVIAAIASEMGALTVAIVTRPFGFEGKRRMAVADWGIHHLLNYVDTLIVIPNEKLLAIANDAPFFESFRIADDFLRQAVQGISDIITTAGVINRDFADVKTTMAGMGYAVMGTASRSGPTRALDAVMAAMESPLLEAGAIDGARGILINITGSSSLRLSEVNDASTAIQSVAHEDANIIFGAVLDERLGDEVKVTVIATGFRNDGRDRSARRAGLNRGADQGTPIIRASATPNVPPPCKTDQSLQPSYDLPPAESPVGPHEPPATRPVAPSDPGELHDGLSIGSSDQLPAFELEEEREERDWKDAIREIARLAEPDSQSEGLADDGAEALTRSNDATNLTHRHDVTGLEWQAEEDFDTDDRATLSGVSADSTQDERDLPADVESAAPTFRGSLRQAALAAYTTVPELDREPEPRHAAPATAFAEIFETRRRLIERSTEEDISGNRSLQEGVVENTNAPTVEIANAGVAPPEHTAAAEAHPKPLPEFNRRLHRGQGMNTSWGLSQATTESRVRVPSFASGVEDDSHTDELDELDIPAFLRRGN